MFTVRGERLHQNILHTLNTLVSLGLTFHLVQYAVCRESHLQIIEKERPSSGSVYTVDISKCAVSSCNQFLFWNVYCDRRLQLVCILSRYIGDVALITLCL